MHLTLTHLFVLSDEGVYRLYDLSNPQTYSQHTLGAEISELGLVSAKAHDDGFVVLTGNLQFLEVRGWAGGRAAPLAEAGTSISLRAEISMPVALLIVRSIRGACCVDTDSP
jgi:hypothetical protein